VLACLFMVFSAIYKYKVEALYYLIVFAVIMTVGAMFYRVKGETVANIISRKIKGLFVKNKNK
jgi:hypothetical protein